MKDLVNGFDNTSTCPYDSEDKILETPTPFSSPYYTLFPFGRDQ